MATHPIEYRYGTPGNEIHFGKLKTNYREN